LPNAVQEMMARTGGFNVPAGYPTGAGMPAPVPATPAQRGSRSPVLPVLGAITAVVATVGVVVGVKMAGRAAHALPSSMPSAPAVASAVPAATALPVPVASASAEPAPAPAPSAAMRTIIVSAVPADAVVARDGTSLGTQPVVLHLAEGESATVSITRKGYKAKTLTLDGNDPKVAVTLESAFGPAPATAAPRRPVDDVGDPFAHKR
jgi:serine/threonine-protein kinase